MSDGRVAEVVPGEATVGSDGLDGDHGIIEAEVGHDVAGEKFKKNLSRY